MCMNTSNKKEKEKNSPKQKRKRKKLEKQKRKIKKITKKNLSSEPWLAGGRDDDDWRTRTTEGDMS